MRRIATAWLFLLVIELFCPAFCDEPAFAAEIKSPTSQIIVSVEDNDKSPETTVSASVLQNQDDEQPVCNDECLCHAAAIPSLNRISFKESYLRKETVAFRYGKPVFNSLPPPFQPPKKS